MQSLLNYLGKARMVKAKSTVIKSCIELHSLLMFPVNEFVSCVLKNTIAEVGKDGNDQKDVDALVKSATKAISSAIDTEESLLAKMNCIDSISEMLESEMKNGRMFTLLLYS